MTLRFAGFVVAGLFASCVSAQEIDWRVTPYLWASGIDGEVGLGNLRRDVDVDFSDLLDVLSGAALLHVEGEKDGHIVFGDLVWMELTPDDEIATIGGVAHAEMSSTIIEAGYAHDTGSSIGYEFGLRYWDFDIEIDPAQLPGFVRGDSWTDVFGGIRNTRDLGSSWTMTTRANIGAGGADLTWGVQLDFARELERGNAFVAGFKLLDIDYEEANVRGIPFVLDTTFFGATLGFMFD